MASQDTCVPAGLGSDPAGATGSPMHSLQDQLQPLLGQVSFGWWIPRAAIFQRAQHVGIYSCNLRAALGSSEALAQPWESDTRRH